MTYTRTKNEAIMHDVVDILQCTHGFVVPEDQEEMYEPKVAFVEGGASGSFMVLTLTDRCDLHVGDANEEWGSNLSIRHGMFNEGLSATAPLEDQLNALPYLLDSDPKEYADRGALVKHMAGILCRMHRNTQALLDGLSDKDREDLRDGEATLEGILAYPYCSFYCSQHGGTE